MALDSKPKVVNYQCADCVSSDNFTEQTKRDKLRSSAQKIIRKNLAKGLSELQIMDVLSKIKGAVNKDLAEAVQAELVLRIAKAAEHLEERRELEASFAKLNASHEPVVANTAEYTSSNVYHSEDYIYHPSDYIKSSRQQGAVMNEDKARLHDTDNDKPWLRKVRVGEDAATRQFEDSKEKTRIANAQSEPRPYPPRRPSKYADLSLEELEKVLNDEVMEEIRQLPKTTPERQAEMVAQAKEKAELRRQIQLNRRDTHELFKKTGTFRLKLVAKSSDDARDKEMLLIQQDAEKRAASSTQQVMRNSGTSSVKTEAEAQMESGEWDMVDEFEDVDWVQVASPKLT